MTLLHDVEFGRKARPGRSQSPARGLPRDCMRKACSLHIRREPQAAARTSTLRGVVGPAVALVVAAAILGGAAFWVSVVRPIEAAADTLGTAAEIVAPPVAETRQARLARAEQKFQAAQRAVSRAPDGASRAEAARRLTDLEAARDAMAR